MIRVTTMICTLKTRYAFPTYQLACYHHNTGPSKQKTILLRKIEHDMLPIPPTAYSTGTNSAIPNYIV